MLSESPAPASDSEANSADAEKRLRIVVTSGGTEVAIDDVRCLTNFSSGTTGAQLAERMLEEGHEVRYLCSRKAKIPFEADLRIDPHKDIELEIARLRVVVDEYRAMSSRLTVDRSKDFHDYREKLLKLVSDPDTDVAVLTMAASDYGPEKVEGKISSSQKELTLKLTPLPKIISELKKSRKDIFLVGFKFLIDVPPDQLIETAYKSMLRDGQDLAVANVGRSGMRLGDMQTFIITIERGIVPVTREELPLKLLKMIEERFSRSYYRTQQTVLPELPLAPGVAAEFNADVKRLSQLALFDSYLAGDRREFGFVAKRCPEGTLITGRGSSKSQADTSDLSLVTGLDETQRVIQVSSTGKKASLNANIAHLIFSRRPEIDYIVHAHIPLAEAVSTGRDSAPGTAEDWRSVEPAVLSGANVIHQPNHGVLVLLKSLEELPEILERNNIYRASAESYDLAYARFQKSARFTDLARAELPPAAKILDMAAGTGEVSKSLFEAGQTDLTLADASPAMLAVARAKLPELAAERFKVARMQDGGGSGEYDALLVRQAINYLAPAELETGLAALKSWLKPGGKLIFNSFNAGELPAARSGREETQDYVIRTGEGNQVEGSLLRHGQRTEIFGKHSGSYELIYDLNSFHIHTEQEFESALRAAGFEPKKIVEGRSLYFVAEALP